MLLLRVVILAVVQGLAELLPVSSSAHVVVAEKLMGLDPSAPEMTLLLVMLHTGTMFAVIVYFWRQWRTVFFPSAEAFRRSALLLLVATAITAVVGEALIKLIEELWGTAHAEVEQLFSHLELIAPALALVGVLILLAGFSGRHHSISAPPCSLGLNIKHAGIIGAVQGLCLPFRGFSRSGATISTGMLLGVPRVRAEEFSFALAVLLTPPVVAREALRLFRFEHTNGTAALASAMAPSILGALCAFVAGLLALRWLSDWLANGRWHWFGVCCLIAAAGVAFLHHIDY
jgi:undecaprenyl-diphosphatase